VRLVRAAVVILVLSFAPLVAVGLLDPSANPIGLGLLSVVGTLVAAAVLAFAALRVVWRRFQ
jgi:hypothetical protein